MKQILLARNAPDESQELQLGLPWETLSGVTVVPRRVPWSRLSVNIGQDWISEQRAYASLAPDTGFVFQNTALPGKHTHPPSDLETGSANQGAVVVIGSNGPTWGSISTAGLHDIRWNSPRLEVQRRDAAGVVGNWETVFTAIARCPT